MPTFDSDQDTILQEKKGTVQKLKKPKKYMVVLLNDDYTPQEFVVWVLQVVFFKTREESQRIMLEAHTTGKAHCGVFPFDIARTKVEQVRQHAAENDFPLECRMEALED